MTSAIDIALNVTDNASDDFRRLTTEAGKAGNKIKTAFDKTKTALNKFGENMQKGRQAMNDFMDIAQAISGTIKAAFDAAAASAKRLGRDDVTGAIDGMTGAFQEMQDTLFQIPIGGKSFLDWMKGAAEGATMLAKLISVVSIKIGQWTGSIDDATAAEMALALVTDDATGSAKNNADAVGKQADELTNATNKTETFGEAWKRMTDAAAEQAKIRFGEITGYWDAVFGGTLDQDVETFKTGQQEIQTEISATRDRIAELEGKSYLTSAQKGELSDLKTKLGDLRTEYKQNADEHSDMTKRIILDLLIQKVTMDGVITAAEEGFVTRMGTALGLFDETTATVLSEASSAWTSFTNGQLTDAENKLWNINRLLTGQTDFDWNLKINVKSDPIPALGEAGLGEAPVIYQPEGEVVTGNQRAAGGPVMPGRPYIVGERGPEIFSPNGYGRILPAAQTAGLSGAGAQINITLNNAIASGIDVEALANRVVRRIQAAGLAGI